MDYPQMDHPTTHLEEKLAYTFKDQGLLRLALTHRSQKTRTYKESFERLEFLGDRVLGLVIAQYLYTHFSNESEGMLAKRLAALVSKSACARIAKELELYHFIKASSFDTQGTSHILSDAVESVLGAIFLESGFESAQTVVLYIWKNLFQAQCSPPIDYKTALQEWSQGKFGVMPFYNVVSSTGPAHAPEFIIEVTVSDRYTTQGIGTTKRMAETKAAEKLYEHIHSQPSAHTISSKSHSQHPIPQTKVSSL